MDYNDEEVVCSLQLKDVVFLKKKIKKIKMLGNILVKRIGIHGDGFSL